MDTEASITEIRKQMSHLWHEAFGDNEDFIAEYFSNYDTEQTRITYFSSSNELISMLHYHKFRYDQYVGSYDYGLATHPKWRHRGLARQIIEESIEKMRAEGIQFAMLIAETPELRDWYSSMGFKLIKNTTLEISGYNDFNFALDDKSLNTPMVRPIDSGLNIYSVFPKCCKVYIPRPKMDGLT